MWIKRWRARGRGVLRPQGSPPPFFSPVPLLLSNCQDSGVATVGLLSSIPRTTYTPPWPFKLTGANVEDSCTQFGYLQKYWKNRTVSVRADQHRAHEGRIIRCWLNLSGFVWEDLCLTPHRSTVSSAAVKNVAHPIFAPHAK